MHIKINFTKALKGFVLFSGLSLILAASLPGIVNAQTSNPNDWLTQTPSQQATTDKVVNERIGSVPEKDRAAAKSPYCKGYFTDLGNYEGSKLQACVTGVLQKLSGVEGAYPSTSAPCMKYSSDIGGGAGDITRKFGICMVAYNAVPATNANKAAYIGGNSASQIKNQAKDDAEAAQAAATSGNAQDQVNCDANESPLSWIACPLIDAGAGMTDYIFNNFVQPLLENVPISADNRDGAFIAWQTFRVLGNAILVGALLIMVFAQNIGRFVDAYTIRKMAPRILVGAIAINISFYLCLAAIDITNVIGNGINQILTAPFIDQNSFNGVKIDATASNNVTGILGLGLLAGAGAAIFGAAATIGALGIISLMLPLIITVALISMAVLFTIVIRQALLIFLTAVSAVAIACFILPGTEKYFRQWWDLFLKTLMVYPIIAVIFAMSNVMASIILRSASGGAVGTAQIITAILVVYAPLVLIPFAFKFAGGAMGNLMDLAGKRAQGLSARASESGALKGRRERARQDLQGGMIQRRADWADRLKGQANSGGVGKKRLYRGLAGAVGGYNIEAQASAFRAARAKELNDQIATGRDEEIRGLTVNKRTANAGAWRTAAAADGYTYGDNDLRRQDSSGNIEYKTLGGAWVSEANVDAGFNRWGGDTFAQQAALSYEMRKAMTNEEVGGISERYADLATGAWGNNEGQARGGFIGAAFENQNQHLEFKYTDAMTGKLDGDKFSEEIYQKRGSYPLAQMSAHTIDQLRESHKNGDANTKRKVEAIAETFMTRYGGGGGVAGMEGDIPITQGMTGAAPARGRGTDGGTYQTNTAGGAAVAEAARQLAVDVGVYRPLDPSTDTHSASGPSNNPRQN